MSVTITSEAYSHFKLCPRRWAFYLETTPIVGAKGKDDDMIEALVSVLSIPGDTYTDVHFANRVADSHARSILEALRGWSLVEGITGLSTDQTMRDVHGPGQAQRFKVAEKLHGIIRDPNNGLWVLKMVPTSTLSDVDKRFLLDDESCLQVWLARKNGYDVVGTLYVVFTRDIPAEKYNKNGTLNAASAKALDKQRLIVHMETRNEIEIKSSVSRALDMGWYHPDDAMQQATPDYKHICRDCPYFAQCVAKEKGLPETVFAWEAVK